jgi:hypothetical protein
MSFDYAVPPFKFSDEQFLTSHLDLLLDYVGYRVQGMFSSDAFRRVFGKECSEGTQAHERLINLEHTSLYRNVFRNALDTAKVGDLWNTKTSIHELLSLVRNPYAKDATRLQAAKELNVLVGITVVDENGKTKAGSSLNDFYAKEGMTEVEVEAHKNEVHRTGATPKAPWEE